MDEKGISYTEKEYDYATDSKKSVISLLHKNPDNLPRGKTETDTAAWEKLKSFREKVERKHTCSYWDNVEELKSKVIVSLTQETKKNPARGWVRADEVTQKEQLEENLKLRKEIDILRIRLEEIGMNETMGTEDLAQGEDSFEIHYQFKAYELHTSPYSGIQYTSVFEVTWNDIFARISPLLIDEITDRKLMFEINKWISEANYDSLSNGKDMKKYKRFDDFEMADDDFRTIIVQFFALNLIKRSEKGKSVKDKSTYWTLTSHGESMMMKVRAIKKPRDKVKPNKAK